MRAQFYLKPLYRRKRRQKKKTPKEGDKTYITNSHPPLTFGSNFFHPLPPAMPYILNHLTFFLLCSTYSAMSHPEFLTTANPIFVCMTNSVREIPTHMMCVPIQQIFRQVKRLMLEYWMSFRSNFLCGLKHFRKLFFFCHNANKPKKQSYCILTREKLYSFEFRAVGIKLQIKWTSENIAKFSYSLYFCFVFFLTKCDESKGIRILSQSSSIRKKCIKYVGILPLMMCKVWKIL